MTLGGAANNQGLFSGRVYDLVLTERTFNKEEVKDLYNGERRIVTAIKKSAELIMFTNSYATVLCVCYNKHFISLQPMYHNHCA